MSSHKYQCRDCGIPVQVNGLAAVHVYEQCARCGGRECSYCGRPKPEEQPTCHRPECWERFIHEHDSALRRFGSLPGYSDVASFRRRS